MARPLSIARDGHVLATEVRWARTAWSRLRGLLIHPPLRRGQAFVIEPAAQVHTFGLGYPIDVLFCDRKGTVLHVVRELAPYRLTRWVRHARYAIELPGGAVPSTLVLGDVLSLDP